MDSQCRGLGGGPDKKDILMEAVILENEVLRLPRTEQVLLVDRLMQALSAPDPRILEAWVGEGERRLAEFQAGRMSANDGETIIHSLRKRLG